MSSSFPTVGKQAPTKRANLRRDFFIIRLNIIFNATIEINLCGTFFKFKIQSKQLVLQEITSDLVFYRKTKFLSPYPKLIFILGRAWSKYIVISFSSLFDYIYIQKYACKISGRNSKNCGSHEFFCHVMFDLRILELKTLNAFFSKPCFLNWRAR